MKLDVQLLYDIFLFLFGKPHKVMYTAATFVGLNGLLDFFRKFEPPKTKMEIVRSLIEKVLAYMAFIIIATRVDSLAVDSLFGWEGSTQFLVCLYIVAREIRVILDYIRARGIAIPGILDSRLNQMEAGNVSGTLPQPITYQGGQEEQVPVDSSFGTFSVKSQTEPASLDEKIQALKRQIEEIEAMRAGNNKNGGGQA